MLTFVVCDPSPPRRLTIATVLTRMDKDALVRQLSSVEEIASTPGIRPGGVVLIPVESCPLVWSATEPLRAVFTTHRVMVYSVAQDPDRAAAAMANGATGLLTLVPTVTAGTAAARTEPSGPHMSPRLQQILLMMSEGLSNSEIGAALGIADSTVKMHCKRLYQLLGAADRAHAVTIGFRSGYLVLD